jgi:hypothetical protein
MSASADVLPDGYSIKLRRRRNGKPARAIYVGFAPDGSEVCELYNRDNVIAALERHEYESRLTTRRCMKCRSEFESEGAHNRMCGRCRGEKSPFPGEWAGGVTMHDREPLF